MVVTSVSEFSFWFLNLLSSLGISLYFTMRWKDVVLNSWSMHVIPAMLTLCACNPSHVYFELSWIELCFWTVIVLEMKWNDSGFLERCAINVVFSRPGRVLLCPAVCWRGVMIHKYDGTAPMWRFYCGLNLPRCCLSLEWHSDEHRDATS